MHAVQQADGTFYAWKISLAAAKHSGQKINHSHSVFKWLGFNGTFNTNTNWQKNTQMEYLKRTPRSGIAKFLFRGPKIYYAFSPQLKPGFVKISQVTLDVAGGREGADPLTSLASYSLDSPKTHCFSHITEENNEWPIITP